MYASFTNKADLSPFTLLSPKIDLNAKNKVTDPGAKASAKLDFSGYDRADEDILNRVIWQSVKGRNAPMPKPAHRVIAVSHRTVKDND